MPKKRMSTAKSRAASARNLVRARYFRSVSAPGPGFGDGFAKAGRRSKLRNKAAYHHAGGFKIDPALAAMGIGKGH